MVNIWKHSLETEPSASAKTEWLKPLRFYDGEGEEGETTFFGARGQFIRLVLRERGLGSDGIPGGATWWWEDCNGSKFDENNILLVCGTQAVGWVGEPLPDLNTREILGARGAKRLEYYPALCHPWLSVSDRDLIGSRDYVHLTWGDPGNISGGTSVVNFIKL